MSVKLSDGEKLILLMLCEMYDHLKVKGETDTRLIRQTIYSGNLWGLEWQLTGVFHGHETPIEVVRETQDILFMWQRLEESFKGLSKEDKKRLAKTSEPFGDNVRFPGFDGNNEGTHLGTAHFFIEVLNRFQYFKGRGLDSHHHTLSGHRRMLRIFDPILHTVLNRNLSGEQLAEVLSSWRAPE